MLQWPASHVRVIAKFLEREPTPEQRIEVAIAHLTQIYVNAHKKGGQVPIEKFMLFRNAWKTAAIQSDRYTAAEKQTLATLMSIGRKAA